MRKSKKLATIMALSLAVSSLTPGQLFQSKAADTTSASNTSSSKLATNIQDGVILHCFCWSYNDIKNELPNIAAAGFTSVQTSPAQPGNGGSWYWLYQPGGFYIANNPLGNKDELKSLCEEADKYGIKVIVDVVANHTAGRGDDGLDGGSDYHSFGPARYDSREGITKGEIGMPDLNSASANVYNKVKGYVEELKGVGVDGIRWDAAKHIELPSEGCEFWKVVTDTGLYNYGEILGSPNERMDESGIALMKEYSEYINVSDSPYGYDTLDRLRNGNVHTLDGFWTDKGIDASKLVYWSENHDTYANDGEYGMNSAYIDQNIVDRGYAVVASRANATALYLSRPFEKSKFAISSGVKGSTHFTEPEVAEVNKLHNAMIGQKDSSEVDQDAKCIAICRETGITVVKASGSGEISMKHNSGVVTPGTYKDSITGNEFTVTYTNITGKIGEKGIATLYLEKASGEPRGTDIIMPTANNNNNNNSNTSENKEVTKIYFDNSTYNWKSVNCYIYSGNSSNGEWPGVEMKKDEVTGYYVYEVPTNLLNGNVIFAESKNETSENRYPADGEPGISMSGKTQLFDGSKKLVDFSVPEIEATPAVSLAPSFKPTVKPTVKPTAVPTAKTTATPTVKPTATPILTITPDPISNADLTYKISYELDDGVFASTTVKYVYHKNDEVKFENPIKEGYIFKGWYTDQSFCEKLTGISGGMAGDITVYAKWTKVDKPGKPTIKLLKNVSGNKLSVVLKSKVGGATGYQIMIAKNAKFTSGKKTYTTKTLSKVISSLSKGTTYYVKVRAYKTDSAGNKVYGAYTAAKTVKIKK
ncbi:MAG: starch-binding protein [Lachnospiraceae bacterium]|nr:starch-binding protein [Lachnospiraceae bacterium]